MKPIWAKDQAEPACKAKRQARTSAATLGIIISAGASNLLLNVPSHSAPVEATLPALSHKPLAASKSKNGSSKLSSGKIEIPLALSTPLKLHTQRELRSTHRVAVTPAAAIAQSSTGQKLSYAGSETRFELPVAKPTQKVAILQALRVNRLVRQLKASKIAKLTNTIASQEIAQETLIVKQRLLIERLKQKSNRQNSLAQLGFEEWQTSALSKSDAVQTGTSVVGGDRLQPVVSLLAFQPQLQVPIALDRDGQAMPYILETVPRSSKPLGAQQRTMPTVVVDRPMALVPIQARSYNVKAGDTLAAISLQSGIPLSTLVAANQLADPNLIRVNQRLIMPMSPSNEIENQPQIAAATASTAATGMGGNISDDDSVVEAAPQNVAEIQRQQSAAAQALRGDRNVQNLRTDLEKLQHKYRNQLLLSQAMPGANPVKTSTNALLRKLRQSPTNRTANLNLNSKQADKTLQEPQKQPRRSVQPDKTEDESGDSLATAPIGTGTGDSLQSIQERYVSPALPPLGSVDTYLPKPAVSKKGFMWPARGVLSSGYGWRWGRMHRGVDIAAPIGTPVFAAAAGTIVKSGWNSGGYGNMVDIQHADGTITRYAHNKRLLVHSGQVVYQGQQISEMGSTGFSTGPHLHFEVHPLGKKAVNPIAFLPR